ncbi:hypothetical protein LI328DRAFT_115973 [Trichoderma asperelloides]|nr:hypothetical protein LI328DRAFT_115973 [Trichoderma asperelloides]
MRYNTVDWNVFEFCTLKTVFNSWISFFFSFSFLFFFFFSFSLLFSPVLMTSFQIWIKQMAIGIVRYKFVFIEILLVQTALASLII